MRTHEGTTGSLKRLRRGLRGGTPGLRSAFAALMFAAASLSGACSSSPRAASAEATLAEEHSSPIPGLSAPEFDPARAFLSLSEIQPAAGATDVGRGPASGLSPAPEVATPLSARGARYLRRAEQLIAEERFTEAAQELEKALRSDPASYEVHRALALAAHGAGNQARASAHAAEALRLNAHDFVSHYLLGRTAFDQADYAGAVRQFRRGLACMDAPSAEQEPFAALIDWYLAKALEKEGYLTAALHQYESFEHRVGRIKTPPARSGQDPTEADQPLTPPVKGQPGVETSHLPPELATLLRVSGGSAADPISRLLERLGRYEEAAEALARLIASRPVDPATRLRQVRLLTAAGRHDDAVEQCRLAAGEEAAATEVVALLRHVRGRTGDERRVVEDVRAIVADRPDDRDWVLAYAELLRRFEEGERAERVLVDYVAAHPTASDMAWKLCDEILRAGRPLDAFRVAARLVAANPGEYLEALAWIDELCLDRDSVDALLALDAGRQGPARVPAEGAAASYLLGVVALRAGEVERGVASLEGALEESPTLLPARLALAEHLLSAYRWEAAVKLLEEADPSDARLEWALGEAYGGLDDHEAAAAHYSAAIRLNRADTRSMFALARLYERTDQPLRAQRQYQALLAVDPLHEQAGEALAGVLIASGQSSEAEGQIRELRKLAASPGCLARLQVRRQLARGEIRLDEFRRVLGEASTSGGADADSLVLLAQLERALNNLPAAEQPLLRVLAAEPDHLKAREILAEVYERQLRFDEARGQWQTLLGRHPNRHEWVERLYDVLMIEPDYAGAEALVASFLDRARLDDRRRTEFRHRRLQALQAARRYDQQIAVAQGWLEEDESGPTQRAWLAAAHLAAGHQQTALELTRRWHLDDPNDAHAASAYRGMLVRTERFTAAEQLVLAEQENDPGRNDLQLALVSILSEAKRYDDALELVESLLPASPNRASLLWIKSAIYQASRDYDRAAALANQILQDEQLLRELDPLDEARFREEFVARLIQALMSAGRHDEAHARLTRWIDETGSPHEKFQFLNLLALVNQQRGRVAEALESLELAHSLRPTDAGINNDLGYTLADMGLRLEEAERMIRFAVAHDPRNTAFLDSLGWVLYRRGEFAPARRWLTRAAQAPDSREDPVIYDHLGDACWRAGSRQEALEHWTEAVDLGEQRLGEREDATYRRVVASASAKLAAVRSGDPPEVAPIGPAGTEAATDGPADPP